MEREERHCRGCGIILRGKDWYMGICDLCIYESSRKMTSVPSPGYGQREAK